MLWTETAIMFYYIKFRLLQGHNIFQSICKDTEVFPMLTEKHQTGYVQFYLIILAFV